MTLEVAVLSFYLLFPLLYPQQENLAKFFGKSLSDNNKVATVRNLKYFIEHPTTESLLYEKIPEIRNLMEELELDTKEELYISSNGSMRAFEYGQEKFTQGHTVVNGKNYTTTVSANDASFSQILWDSQKRMTEKTVWNNSTKSSLMKMLKKSEYKYDFKNDPTRVSVIDSIDYEKKSAETTTYNENGKPIVYQTFNVKNGKRSAISKIRYTYDKKGRLTKESFTSYVKGTPNSQTTFSYTAKSSNPDSFYYEDGILRKKTIYIAESLWEETIQFDYMYTIKAVYDNGKKISEDIYMGNKKIRSRNYE